MERACSIRLINAARDEGVVTRPTLFLFAALLSLALVVSTVSSADDSGGDHVFLSKAPQVSVNLTSSLTVNVSYSYLFVSDPQGVLGANLGLENWTLSNNSGSYRYVSSFSLNPINDSDLADKYRSIMNVSDETNLSSANQTPLPVRAIVDVSRYNGSLSSLNIFNRTTMENTTLSGINVSTLKLSFSLFFNISADMASNGYITTVVVQSLGGTEGSLPLNYNQVGTSEDSSSAGDGLAMANGTHINTTQAVYWWNNSYVYNGNAAKDNASVVSSDSALMVAFVFKTPVAKGPFELVQDPYISVRGANLVGGKIVTYAQPVVNFLLQHMEFFAGGILVGGGVFLAMYGKYRRKKIRI